jgi:large subunit ribosomal protein L37e
MAKGTPSFGKKVGVKHIRCRRCGHVTFHIKKGVCSYCGFGKKKKLRSYTWQNKTHKKKRKKRK